jgi:hypothetical protein
VFNLPQTRQCDFTIHCEKCGENIPAPVRHHAGLLDCRALPALRREKKLSSIRDLPRQSVVQTWPKASALSGDLMGEMKRANAHEREAWADQMQEQKRMKLTLVIAAAMIAAVRLARERDISRPSPRLTSVVSESVSLARMILDRVGRQQECGIGPSADGRADRPRVPTAAVMPSCNLQTDRRKSGSHGSPK